MMGLLIKGNKIFKLTWVYVKYNCSLSLTAGCVGLASNGCHPVFVKIADESFLSLWSFGPLFFVELFPSATLNSFLSQRSNLDLCLKISTGFKSTKFDSF